MARRRRASELHPDDPGLVNGFDEGARSPLCTATWLGRADVVRLPLEHGAEPTIRHLDSPATALDSARGRDQDEVVALDAATEAAG